jgi:hypothetical protein
MLASISTAVRMAIKDLRVAEFPYVTENLFLRPGWASLVCL